MVAAPVVLPEFWAADQMRDALASWHMGKVIAAYRPTIPFTVAPSPKRSWPAGQTSRRRNSAASKPARRLKQTIWKTAGRR
jgi:hypothetical protein